VNANDRKVILVTRRTRLEDLVARYQTLEQARFYLEHLGADFSDYVRENAAYAQGMHCCVEALQAWGRYQVLDRAHLPNFVFGRDDIVVTLGQDGLVANTLKYLAGQPVIGLNPEPTRWDGVLLPFEPQDLGLVLPAVSQERRPIREVTMAEAKLSDGQTLLAVNDLFVGPRSHTSALYELELGSRREFQSSSGLIVATGLGSTAWFRSIVTGSLSIATAWGGKAELPAYQALPWETDRLRFAVREPFPSKSSTAELVYGEVMGEQTLKIHSRMPENGVIFSDGMEADHLQFTAGMEATIGLAKVRGCLVV
jgi:NAD kinase